MKTKLPKVKAKTIIKLISNSTMGMLAGLIIVVLVAVPKFVEASKVTNYDQNMSFLGLKIGNAWGDESGYGITWNNSALYLIIFCSLIALTATLVRLKLKNAQK